MEGALYNAMSYNDSAKTTTVLPDSCTIASPGGVALADKKETAPMQLFTTVRVPLVCSARVTLVGHDAVGDGGFLVSLSPGTGDWAKLAFEHTGGKAHSVVATVSRAGAAKKEAAVAVKGHHAFLRMAVEEDNTWFHWSEDGKQWHLVAKFASVKGEDVNYGFGVESPAGKGATYKFDAIVGAGGTVKDK